MMKNRSFTIIASASEMSFEEAVERLFQAGCDDATPSLQKGLIVIEFDREARTFVHALISAVRDVRRAGLRIERVEPDHLVNAADIANRAGLGRAAVSHYVKGQRAKHFPSPIARCTTDSPLYDWAEVASWLHRERNFPLSEVVWAKAVREINMAVVAHVAGQHSVPRTLRKTLELIAA